MILNDSNINIGAQTATKRLVSIDLLRGLVMLLMALDHVRSFFSNPGFSALDINQSNLPLFFTRWVTHLCAPSFVFLAGIGVYLSLQRGKNRKELTYFLLTRGVWLIFLDLTLVSFAWTFAPGVLVLGVLWAIGCSMIILAALIHLPLRSVLIVGILLIAGHNLFDNIQAESINNLPWLWSFLHERKMFMLFPGIRLILGYPLIPWVGVMAVGFGWGKVFSKAKRTRLLWLRNTGLSLILSFILLRGINIYGDPQPWSFQSNSTKTFLSFIDCEKYPPSLLYLLITLGIALLILYLFEVKRFRYLQPLITFGRVPLFFYLIHLWLIHLTAILLSFPKYGLKAVFLPYLNKSSMPADYGYNLLHVYMIFLVIIIVLYPVCNWFGNYKYRHKYWWLKYF